MMFLSLIFTPCPCLHLLDEHARTLISEVFLTSFHFIGLYRTSSSSASIPLIPNSAPAITTFKARNDHSLTDHHRLRQTDVKAGHYERKVQVLEKERDQWEQKYEDMSQKHNELKKQLEDLTTELGGL